MVVALGEESPQAVSVMNNLALLLENQGLYDEAEPLFKKAFANAKKISQTEVDADILAGGDGSKFALTPYKIVDGEAEVLPDVRTLDYLKRGLDEEINRLFKAGKGNQGTALKKLRDQYVEIPESELMALPEGQYYRFQFIGLHVIDLSGRELGTITEVLETGSNDVYLVQGLEGEHLVPALSDFIKNIDLSSRSLIVDLPDTL